MMKLITKLCASGCCDVILFFSFYFALSKIMASARRERSWQARELSYIYLLPFMNMLYLICIPAESSFSLHLAEFV